MEIDKLRNQIYYDELPEWRKFLHAYKFTFKQVGISALWKFPFNYYKLWKQMKK